MKRNEGVGFHTLRHAVSPEKVRSCTPGDLDFVWVRAYILLRTPTTFPTSPAFPTPSNAKNLKSSLSEQLFITHLIKTFRQKSQPAGSERVAPRTQEKQQQHQDRSVALLQPDG